MDSTQAPVLFHLAFPVADIPTAKSFYVEGLGCEAGRESANSIILNLYNHQIVAHTTDDLTPQKGIYPRHFGLVFLAESDFDALLNRALANGLKLFQQPKRRFAGSPLEHRTFFLEDPFYNLLEFKYYCHPQAIFGEVAHAQVGETH
ncbi:VOC family protein [Halomicronema sp. CCY15110]|uniref:VOC family protein n=1 Tax=Halomicronema sp. CCY15110 TaxID=2767773 RepID=UPI00194ED66D|nr:VOC family protein [Halomicronema sp. CCY15110]